MLDSSESFSLGLMTAEPRPMGAKQAITSSGVKLTNPEGFLLTYNMINFQLKNVSAVYETSKGCGEMGSGHDCMYTSFINIHLAFLQHVKG